MRETKILIFIGEICEIGAKFLPINFVWLNEINKCKFRSLSVVFVFYSLTLRASAAEVIRDLIASSFSRVCIDLAVSCST